NSISHQLKNDIMIIKKLLFAAGLLLIGIGASNAQIGDQTSLGPRVGVNFSNVSNVEGSESLSGLAIGLTSTYSISEKTGLTIDLLYSGEGYKLNSNELRLSYLQIPIFFDLFFGELGEKFRPKVYAGIQPGFLLDSKNNGSDVEDVFSGFNLAVGGGLGFNYRVGSRIWLNTDLRAALGLSDIREDVIGDKVASSNIQLSLGLAYGLSKI
ncbi:MAG: PorT family protein, partial [Saprospiraceae bacterium]|nr:PorT family protein [Saprospiraceae bacterium]MBP9744447.1 PorT family protein [Saprospiraceae bacterium]